jgi:hypothetical protein
MTPLEAYDALVATHPDLEPVARVVVMCLQSLVLGALLVGMAGALTGSAGAETLSSPWEVIGWAAALAFLGVIFVGIPMLALIGPAVVLWTAVIRRSGVP